MWKNWEIGNWEIEAKVYDIPSDWGLGDGIENGCVSKLRVKHDGEFVVNYDRGWDLCNIPDATLDLILAICGN